jgi:hypothetical protein
VISVDNEIKMKNFLVSILAITLSSSVLSLAQTSIDSTKIVIVFSENISVDPPLPDTILLADYKDKLREAGARFEGYTLADIDSDGTSELLLNVYSGGAHCCSELIVLRQIAPDTFRSVHTFNNQYTVLAGDEVHDYVMPDYYHTCHACWQRYQRLLDPVARYRLKDSHFFLAPALENIDTTLFVSELSRLSTIPIPQLKSQYDQDSGERAAYASVLLAYYYYTYDLNTTKRWFTKYYLASDAEQIWAELESLMQSTYTIMK